MGTTQTNLKINHFFHKPNNFIPNTKPLLLTIKTHHLIGCLIYENGVVSQITYEQSCAHGGDFYGVGLNSHMRDFEVIPGNNLTIARGQGIGVIIDFSRQLYIKLWMDKANSFGYSLYITEFPTMDLFAAEHILSSDLAIGYDVFLIDYYGNEHRLCEEKDERDKKECLVIFKDFEKYTKYDRDIDKKNDIQRSNKNINTRNPNMKKIIIVHNGDVVNSFSDASKSESSEDDSFDDLTISSEEDVSTFQCMKEGCYNNAKHKFKYKEDEFMLCEKCITNAEKICDTLLFYDNEKYTEKIKRSKNSKEWHFVAFEDKVAIDDVDCLFGSDTCWFHGNLDRLQEYDGCYTLKGTEGLISMCRVCWEKNSSIDDYAVESMIKHHFRTAIDDEKIYKEIYSKLFDKTYEKLKNENNWKLSKPTNNDLKPFSGKQSFPRCLLFNYISTAKCDLNGKNKNISYWNFVGLKDEMVSSPRLYLCDKCFRRPNKNDLLEPVCSAICEKQAKIDAKYY